MERTAEGVDCWTVEGNIIHQRLAPGIFTWGCSSFSAAPSKGDRNEEKKPTTAHVLVGVGWVFPPIHPNPVSCFSLIFLWAVSPAAASKQIRLTDQTNRRNLWPITTVSTSAFKSIWTITTTHWRHETIPWISWVESLKKGPRKFRKKLARNYHYHKFLWANLHNIGLSWNVSISREHLIRT